VNTSQNTSASCRLRSSPPRGYVLVTPHANPRPSWPTDRWVLGKTAWVCITPPGVVWRGTTGAAQEHGPGYRPGDATGARSIPEREPEGISSSVRENMGGRPVGYTTRAIGSLPRGPCCRCRGADGPVVRCAVRQQWRAGRIAQPQGPRHSNPGPLHDLGPGRGPTRGSSACGSPGCGAASGGRGLGHKLLPRRSGARAGNASERALLRRSWVTCLMCSGTGRVRLCK
jgi:hypothetical protein